MFSEKIVKNNMEICRIRCQILRRVPEISESDEIIQWWCLIHVLNSLLSEVGTVRVNSAQRMRLQDEEGEDFQRRFKNAMSRDHMKLLQEVQSADVDATRLLSDADDRLAHLRKWDKANSKCEATSVLSPNQHGFLIRHLF